jgi:class 3 adenylate cyclase
MGAVETVQAYTVTVNIAEFSKQTGERQWRWYSALKGAMSKALGELQIAVATNTDGKVFWSPGNDGGTLTIVRGGAALALRFAALTAGEVNRAAEDRAAEPFGIRVGIDKGQVHIGIDLNAGPNVWGTAINNSHLIASTCAPGQVLASDGFVDELLRQTGDLNDYIDRGYLEKRQPLKRLAKHGQFFAVVNVHHAGERVGLPAWSETPVHVADFEGPFAQMLGDYRHYLTEAVRAKSGIWTLMLARKLHDLRALTTEELLKKYVLFVSAEEKDDAAHLPDPFFSCFPAHELHDVLLQGTFQNLEPGRELCKVGDRGQELYVIAHGRLEISDAHGVVAVREPGSIVGEMALVEAGYLEMCVTNPKRTARMVAAKDRHATLFAIPYDAIRRAAKSSKEILQALVTSYSKRQKENALREARCFQDLRPDDRAFLRAVGDLKGLRPGTEWSDEGPPDCLIVCCHGKIVVERGGNSRSLRGHAGGPMESVWLPGYGAPAQRLTVKTETASEFLFWSRPNWRKWLESSTNRNLRGYFAEVCDARL